MSRAKSALVAVIALSLAGVTAGPAVAVGAARAELVSASDSRSVLSGVCTGVEGCHVRAHTDVTGDGVADAVGVAGRGDGADRRVIVRVRTEGTIVSERYRAPYWLGPLWQGVAQLDGRPGKEIVVGQTLGAHAQLYRALTWRRGGPATLDAPGLERYWLIDSAYSFVAGWQVRDKDAAGTIRQRMAERVSSTGSRPFRGRIHTYQWRPGHWHKVSTQKVPRMHEARAYRWGGFSIDGLPRW
jgi:hypothetical protein